MLIRPIIYVSSIVDDEYYALNCERTYRLRTHVPFPQPTASKIYIGIIEKINNEKLSVSRELLKAQIMAKENKIGRFLAEARSQSRTFCPHPELESEPP